MINTCYRPPSGDVSVFRKCVKSLLHNNYTKDKLVYTVGDFNINVLDYDKNKNVRSIFDLFFRFNHVPLINKPTRITKTNATAIDHIVTNNFMDDNFETGIIKSDISDHYPIFVLSPKTINNTESNTVIFKRNINEKTINNFKTKLANTDWSFIYNFIDSNNAYEYFLKIFKKLYDDCFPKQKITMKTKSFQSPWMSTGLLKSSKKKQKLYEKYLKTKLLKMRLNIKITKTNFIFYVQNQNEIIIKN